MGFIIEFMVKMIVYDETMTFYVFFENSNCFRNLFLIWGSFGYFLGIENQSVLIEKSKFYETCIFIILMFIDRLLIFDGKNANRNWN